MAVFRSDASNALEELCFTITRILPKLQSSVLHPLLQLVPQLHERRMKRFKVDEEFRGPMASRSHGYFLFRDPNEDTEWNEILRDFGILPPKEEPKDEIEEMVLRLQKEAMVKPYEKMTLAQLKEAEDEFDDEDLKAIEIYRYSDLFG
ncbi:hypothetical protein CB1_000310009 [Camelus ferus]|nr:hypothetical protein CB1_000310009 [Camelus ferus]